MVQARVAVGEGAALERFLRRGRLVAVTAIGGGRRRRIGAEVGPPLPVAGLPAVRVAAVGLAEVAADVGLVGAARAPVPGLLCGTSVRLGGGKAAQEEGQCEDYGDW